MVLGKFTERVSATEKRGKRIMYFLAFQSVQILERLNSSRCWLRPRPHWIWTTILTVHGESATWVQCRPTAQWTPSSRDELGSAEALTWGSTQVLQNHTFWNRSDDIAGRSSGPYILSCLVAEDLHSRNVTLDKSHLPNVKSPASLNNLSQGNHSARAAVSYLEHGVAARPGQLACAGVFLRTKMEWHSQGAGLFLLCSQACYSTVGCTLRGAKVTSALCLPAKAGNTPEAQSSR